MATTTQTETTEPKSKRPSDSEFKQQRLPAWQPILTAGTVLPTFFVIGIAFIPVGVGLLYFSDQVEEFSIDYTDCENNQGLKVAEMIDRPGASNFECVINFTLDKDFKVFQSRKWKKGNFLRFLTENCKNPISLKKYSCLYFLNVNFQKENLSCGKIYSIQLGFLYPRLSIIRYHNYLPSPTETFTDQHIEVPLIRTGIAWPSDKKIKFRNPEGDLNEVFKNFAKPKNWNKNLTELDPENPDNNGLQNEDLIVWMRTAALPSFRKLYRRINHTDHPFIKGLPKGNYQLIVNYSYPVKSFEGTKHMILSTTSILGGKNPFLGIAYIVVGAICLLLGIVFLFIHIKCGKSDGGEVPSYETFPEPSASTSLTQ